MEGRKEVFNFVFFIVEIHLQHLLHVNKSPISKRNKRNHLNVLQEQRCIIFSAGPCGHVLLAASGTGEMEGR